MYVMYPTQEVYDAYPNEFALLDLICEFSPQHMLKYASDKKNIDMVMKFDYHKYSNWSLVVRKLKTTLVKKDDPNQDDSPKLYELRKNWPLIPEFPDCKANSLFSKFQFEVAACMFRDQAKRYMAYMFYFQQVLKDENAICTLDSSTLSDV